MTEQKEPRKIVRNLLVTAAIMALAVLTAMGANAASGGELFASRRERSITRSTFEKALRKIQEAPGEMSGPKKLNVYGAPYVWAILWEVFLREEMQGGRDIEYFCRTDTCSL